MKNMASKKVIGVLSLIALLAVASLESAFAIAGCTAPAPICHTANVNGAATPVRHWSDCTTYPGAECRTCCGACATTQQATNACLTACAANPGGVARASVSVERCVVTIDESAEQLQPLLDDETLNVQDGAL